MGLRKYDPTTPARRFFFVSDFAEVSKKKPERVLLSKKSSSGGRNSYGRATNINIGGGHKQRYRIVDFRREKKGIPATVKAIEYDPNRSARLALLYYADGEKRYILAPNGLKVNDQVLSGENIEVKPGNALPIKQIPLGMSVHNVEMKVGRGGQAVRSAGCAAQLIAKEGRYGLLRMPSGEIRKVFEECYATIGEVGFAEYSNISIGKAGRSRWLGIRPHVRGVAKNPVDHPMGGGEGRASGGRHPCTPAGKPTKGLKTRKNKRTNKFIMKKRLASAK
ncbi:MAG: 50S ribosomal protein L2 [SAR324 cluster bacterium]|uniref:Large ribosomal subunit protein uL2 n=1 Tax=SAR324 cluster bacterium TaxID=2024889 RepID=A0A7X9FPR5_9DELT|nr:50S ribosomal protein L2 [SAR324 cluster bacterium]